MIRAAIAILFGAVLVTGCLFPSFDGMQGGQRAPGPNDDPNATAQGDASTTVGSSGVTTSSTPLDASTAPIDAGVDATAKAPATIACADEVCPVGDDNFCCSAWGGGCGKGQSGPNGRTACGGTLRQLDCDETSDCATGVCCFIDEQNRASCRADCAGGKVLCNKSAPSCPGAQTCTGVLDHGLGFTSPFCK